MVYNAFLETVRQSVSSRLGAGYHVTIMPVRKNNGLVLDGLCISKDGDSIAPAIYLNSLYEKYQLGHSIRLIADDILNAYRLNALPKGLELESLKSRDEILSRIVFRVMNTTANEALLKEIPHIPFPDLDLSLAFSLIYPSIENLQFSSLFCQTHQIHWSLSTEELFQAASVNSPRLLPASIQTMTEVIKAIAKETLKGDFEDEDLDEMFPSQDTELPLYVLGNPTKLYGASCMFYEGILKDFADHAGSDLIILPSSVHEVLLTPYHKNISYEDLARTVSSINTDQVPLQYQLSNHIYYYSRSQDAISVAFTSSCPVGTKNP